MALNARLAFVAPDRQLHLLDLSTESHTQLTLSLGDNPLLRWGNPDLPQTGYAWPCWSPDGDRIACFQFPQGDDVSDPIGVHIVELDGLTQTELLQVPGRVPIYAAWQPNGEGLGVLLQQEEEIELGYCRLDDIGRLRVLDQGAPLFFTWGSDARRVFVRSGSPDNPLTNRLVVRDTKGEMPDAAPPQEPGQYCTPLVVGDRLIQVEQCALINRLISTTFEGDQEKLLLEFDGLGAAVPVPGKNAIVFSSAPDGGNLPYRGATWIDIDTTKPTRLTEDDCVAFFWSPGGAQLIYVGVDKTGNCLTWYSVRDNENPVELCRFWPSREMLFYLHFFDQFVRSHHLVSADGRFLVFSGHLHEDGPPEGPPNILVLDLRGEAPIRVVSAGFFACFCP